MSTETSPSKPVPVSKVTSCEADSQKTACCSTTHIDKSQAAVKIATELNLHPKKAEGLETLLKQLASPDSVERATAAGALGRAANIAAAPALIAALNDADADVAREAATSLGLLGSATAVDPLIAVLADRNDYFHSVVRIAAMHSLGSLRDQRAVVPLLNAVRDPIAEASAEAIRALASLNDPRALPALLEVVRNEQGFFLATTRRAAIMGLAQIGGEQAACELRFVAANQWEDAVVRAAAIEATRDGSTSAAGA